MDTRGIAEERRKVWIDANSLLMCDSLKKNAQNNNKTIFIFFENSNDITD